MMAKLSAGSLALDPNSPDRAVDWDKRVATCTYYQEEQNASAKRRTTER